MQIHKLKITIRNARKNGVLTFAKLFGLTLSFAVVLFAAGYVYYETSFDKSIPDHDRIYRCLMQGQLSEEKADYAVTSPAQATAMTNDVPGIIETMRMLGRGTASFKKDETLAGEGQLYNADPNFFTFFSIPLTSDLENPLAADNNLVVAKSIAEKQFGSAENALGKILQIRREDFVITGVFDDLPGNFHLQVDFVQPLHKSNPDEVGWGSQSYYTYFKTAHPNANVDELNFKITQSVYIHSDDRVDAANAKTMADLKYTDNIYLFYTCEPLKAIHFSNHKFDPAKTSNKTYVYGAIIIALLILVISSVNFINLTLANILTRLKEVGIRKTLGACKNNITSQFLYETFVFFIVSFVLAVALYLSISSPLAHYLGFDILLSNKLLGRIIAGAFVALLLFSLAVNIIPIILTSNKKILSLIKNDNVVQKHQWKKHGFILVQFILSGLIILSSVIVQKQINFVVNKDRGYDSGNVIMLSMWDMSPQSRESFIEKLKTYNTVQAVTTSDVYFGEDFSMNSAYFETNEEQNYFHTSVLPADDEFLNTFGLQMKEGRYFEKQRKTDDDAVILNEAAVTEYLGEGSLIGKKVIVGDRSYNVIGIIKDFNFRSLHHKIEPLVMTRVENFGNLCVKVRNAQIPEVLGILQNLWKEFKIEFPFSYRFHDEVVARHYANDQQAKKLLLFLSVISLLIASVGLYAVSFFSILRKTKEIGIRKVNGAKISEILTMLNKDFVKWVVIAFVIATPIAYYAMHKWLENFAYKTSLSWWIFALAGLLALGIALLTVSWQSWKAATRNPVEALRYE
ncbi:MAG TPA: ABC transporter permease [Draconibacterium sp.]|nr:ABC transporter permease [Draconibacterium sp.]